MVGCNHWFKLVETDWGSSQVCIFCGIDAWTYQNPGKPQPGSVPGTTHLTINYVSEKVE